MKEKVKYNIEKELILNNWVVDPVNHASFQEPINVNGYPEIVNLDLSKSNYFIIDLEDNLHTSERNVSLNPINYNGIERFEVLFLEPFGKRHFNFDPIIFQMTPFFLNQNFEEIFEMRMGQRRLMLMSFKSHPEDESIVFIGDVSPWSETIILNVMIVFFVKDQNNNPVSNISIHLGFFPHTVEIKQVFNGVCVFSVPRGYTYSYTGYKYGVIPVFGGSISSTTSNVGNLTIERTVTT